MAGDWGAAARIRSDQWQSSIRSDQSEERMNRGGRNEFVSYEQNHMMAAKLCQRRPSVLPKIIMYKMGLLLMRGAFYSSAGDVI